MLSTANRLRREEGFTLIELMIVVVVLGILAGLVLLGVTNFQQDAKDAKSSTDLDTCATAKVAADAYNETHDLPDRTANDYVAAGTTCP